MLIKLAPAEFLIGMKSNLDAGMCCLVHTDPRFRERAQQGFNVVVGGKGFGCGSSREQAVMALLGKSSPTISLERIRVFEFPFDHKLPFRMRRSMCYREIVCVHIPTQHAKPGPPRHHNGRGFLLSNCE